MRDEARLRLAAIVDSADVAIIGKDLSGVITSWNRAAEEMFGYRASEAIGRSITLIFPPERAAEEGAILEKIRRGEHIGHLETEQIRKDGRRIPVSLTISPVINDTGEIIGISRIARDLTARRAREQRLAELQAEFAHVARVNELGQMASALAHELSQPLAAMANYRSALRQLLKANKIEEARDVVERIGGQAERAHLMIARLRALVHKGKTAREVSSLRKCIEAASALALVGLDDDLTFERKIAGDAAYALIDRIQIQQVLLNLIRNAAEAMVGAKRRVLTIATTRCGEMVEITVADTGPGLAQAVREHLFEPFITTKPAGLGVGLSVCRTIIEAHGGQLTAADAPLGGTIFHFTLPGAGS